MYRFSKDVNFIVETYVNFVYNYELALTDLFIML